MERLEYPEQILPLQSDTVAIWGAHVPGMVARMDALQAVLTESERVKADRLSVAGQRNALIVARGALRVLLGAYAQRDPAELEFSFSDQGKPFLDQCPVSFNVSHSGEWVVLAAGCGREVGVDIEKIRTNIDVYAVARRFFHPAEMTLIKQAGDPSAFFFQVWARKEALVKARGAAILQHIKSASIPLTENGLPDAGMAGGWHVHRLEAGTHYASALATDRPVENLPCYDFGGLRWEG